MTFCQLSVSQSFSACAPAPPPVARRVPSGEKTTECVASRKPRSVANFPPRFRVPHSRIPQVAGNGKNISVGRKCGAGSFQNVQRQCAGVSLSEISADNIAFRADGHTPLFVRRKRIGSLIWRWNRPRLCCQTRREVPFVKLVVRLRSSYQLVSVGDKTHRRHQTRCVRQLTPPAPAAIRPRSETIPLVEPTARKRPSLEK